MLVAPAQHAQCVAHVLLCVAYVLLCGAHVLLCVAYVLLCVAHVLLCGALCAAVRGMRWCSARHQHVQVHKPGALHDMTSAPYSMNMEVQGARADKQEASKPPSPRLPPQPCLHSKPTSIDTHIHTRNHTQRNTHTQVCKRKYRNRLTQV